MCTLLAIKDIRDLAQRPSIYGHYWRFSREDVQSRAPAWAPWDVRRVQYKHGENRKKLGDTVALPLIPLRGTGECADRVKATFIFKETRVRRARSRRALARLWLVETA
jgi:hypothetical protein